MVSTDLPELVDWQLAARVGRRVAGGSELPVRPAWSRQFTELSATADLAVAELTGLGGDLPPPVARPLDRGEWVDANLATLRRVLRPLDDGIEVYPGHGAGSACGRAMSAKTASTIGFERRFNPAFRYDSKSAFVEFLMQGVPPKPAAATRSTCARSIA